MAFDEKLADRVRTRLATLESVGEKKMFGGLAFLLNGKMCINISGDRLMCRFDPERTEEVQARTGYQPMIMKGKKYKGYCYVEPDGFRLKRDFEYWVLLCLDFNSRAKKSSGKKKSGKKKK